MDKFNYEANGYNRQEVNQFVKDVIVQTEGIIKKCEYQKEEMLKLEHEEESLKAELKHYAEMETTLKEAIMKAEETSVNIKKIAHDEANLIIKEAKGNASRIVNEALLKADKIASQAETLERNMKIFKRKLKAILDQEQAVVDEIEVLELNPKD